MAIASNHVTFVEKKVYTETKEVLMDLRHCFRREALSFILVVCPNERNDLRILSVMADNKSKGAGRDYNGMIGIL